MKQCISMPTYINGDRIYLKIISPNEEMEIEKIVSFHKDNSRFIDRYIGSSQFKTYKAAKFFIEQDYKQYLSKTSFNYYIYLKDNTLIGKIFFEKKLNSNDTLNGFYYLGVDFRGKKYIQEAYEYITPFLKNCNFKQIELTIDETNIASSKTAKSIGFNLIKEHYIKTL